MLVVLIPYKAIKTTTKELNPKSTDQQTANVSLFQKNCPMRQINKDTKKQTRKISHASIVYPSITALAIAVNPNPIGITKTISCQNFSTDFNDLLFISLTV
jgi:hypothetical protein